MSSSTACFERAGLAFLRHPIVDHPRTDAPQRESHEAVELDSQSNRRGRIDPGESRGLPQNSTRIEPRFLESRRELPQNPVRFLKRQGFRESFGAQPRAVRQADDRAGIRRTLSPTSGGPRRDTPRASAGAASGSSRAGGDRSAPAPRCCGACTGRCRAASARDPSPPDAPRRRR